MSVLQFPAKAHPDAAHEERRRKLYMEAARKHLRTQLNASLPYELVMSGIKHAHDKHDALLAARYIGSDEFDALPADAKGELLELWYVTLLAKTGATP
jgi:hypothetical protein